MFIGMNNLDLNPSNMNSAWKTACDTYWDVSTKTEKNTRLCMCFEERQTAAGCSLRYTARIALDASALFRNKPVADVRSRKLA
ncbi:unnamed protein product [Gongylonema pulchrum]|uniref:Apple domain-containing protein n=1 Tax=Gongylonema pulchrum TaxID=637853 RepID=A0A183EIM3_9BILA|nr:unnamed protein product [Gongylonema pulchrum]